MSVAPALRRLARGCALGAAVAAGLLTAAAPAHAAVPTAPGFDVLPAAGSLTDEHGSFFDVRVAPGGAVRQAITITNPTRVATTYVVRAVAAGTGPLGGATYEAPRVGEPGTRVAWLRVDRGRVRIEPGGTATVGVTVRMPADAPAGERLAGIAVEAVEPPARRVGRRAGTWGGASAGVVVRTRRIVAVRATVPGPLVPLLHVEEVTAQSRPDGTYLVVHLRNHGNVIVDASGAVQVFGDAPIERAFDIDTFVPDTSIEHPVRWTDEPRVGTWPATVVLTFGDRTVRWHGKVRVGEAQVREHEHRAVPGAGAEVPWSVYALLAAVLGGSTIATVLRRRALRRGWATAGDWYDEH